jgi:predicted small secreted protein
MMRQTHRNTLRYAIAIAALLSAIPLLGACQTTAGAGRDLSTAGDAVTDSAVKHAPAP